MSICREIINRIPALSLTYLSDNAAFPYGEKTASELEARVVEIVDCALDRLVSTPFDAIVIACNSASTLALPALRAHCDIPVVGVVPAIKTAATNSQTRTIGLLATPGTVSRDYTADLIEEHAGDCEVVSVGSSELVQIVESHLHGETLDSDSVEAILACFDEHSAAVKMDCVVLGCTHFPLIREMLEQLRPQWLWVDSGRAIASRLDDVCSAAIANAKADSTEKKTHRFYLSAPAANEVQQAALAQAVAAFGFSELTVLD